MVDGAGRISEYASSPQRPIPAASSSIADHALVRKANAGDELLSGARSLPEVAGPVAIERDIGQFRR